MIGKQSWSNFACITAKRQIKSIVKIREKLNNEFVFIFKYFTYLICFTEQQSHYTHISLTSFRNESCFAITFWLSTAKIFFLTVNNTETTELTKVGTLVSRSYQTQWTKPSENVTASTLETDSFLSVSRAKSSNIYTANYVTQADFTKKLSQISTRRIQNTAETHIINNSTLEGAKGSALGGQNTGIGIYLVLCLTHRWRCRRICIFLMFAN